MRNRRQTVRLAMEVFISLAVLALGFFLVLTADWKVNPELGAAGTGFVGTVIGRWFR